jgi:hypothetical protein
MKFSDYVRSRIGNDTLSTFELDQWLDKWVTEWIEAQTGGCTTGTDVDLCTFCFIRRELRLVKELNID